MRKKCDYIVFKEVDPETGRQEYACDKPAGVAMVTKAGQLATELCDEHVRPWLNRNGITLDEALG